MSVDKLIWHILCMYGWILLASILFEQVHPKIFGSDNRSGTDNKGSRSGSVAGHDTAKSHYSFFDFEVKNFSDNIN